MLINNDTRKKLATCTNYAACYFFMLRKILVLASISVQVLLVGDRK